MKNKFIYLILFSFLFLFACADSTTGPGDPPANVKRGLLIVNEGLYAQNNSSLTFFSFDENKVYSDVYKNANSGNNLGDTGNDLFVYDNKGYATIDLSNKIEVINLNNFESEGFIDLGQNAGPRELIIINSNEGYVTSTGKDAVIKFNPSSKTVLVDIKVGSKPEGIEIYQDRIFVANSGYGSDSTISVIRNDEKVHDIIVSVNPRFIHKDNEFIYVVCSGGFFDPQGTGAVYKINPLTYDILAKAELNGNPGESCLTNDGYMLVVNNDGIHKLDLNTFKFLPGVLVSASSVNPTTNIIYSVFYDSEQQRIYAGNPKDFMQNGEIVIYENDGTEISRFDSGINPGTISIIDQYLIN